MRAFRFFLGLSSALAVSAVALGADVASTLKKARAYLGPEATLAAVTSVAYRGNALSTENTSMRVDIVFQRPDRQRITARTNERVEVTGLDGYEGWQRVEDTSDKSRWRLALLGKDQVKRLRANAWENLSFYQGIESRGGQTKDGGVTTIDGRSAHKIIFDHGDGIVFTRFFDLENGRLILTQTDQGGSIREEGEIMAGGLRFPKKVTTTNKMADGQERSITITFDEVVVNQVLPATEFAVPPFATTE